MRPSGLQQNCRARSGRSGSTFWIARSGNGDWLRAISRSPASIVVPRTSIGRGAAWAGYGRSDAERVRRAGLKTLDPRELNPTLAAALGIADARLEVLDFSNQPLPAGRLEFPLTGLNKPPVDAPEAPVVWRGRLVYDGDRSLAVWAKVRIAVERPVLIAAEQIAAGATIHAGRLKMVQAAQFPFSRPWLDSVSQASGKIARRRILAGQMISPAALAEPQDVHRADQVHVRVVDGQATLSLDAVAESSGSKGDVIMLRNPSTGKIFRATVEDKGLAVLQSSGGVE